MTIESRGADVDRRQEVNVLCAARSTSIDSPRTPIQSFSKEELRTWLGELDPRRARMRSSQLTRWTYQRLAGDFSEMTDISHSLRAWLAERSSILRLAPASDRVAEDGTRKILWKLEDGKTVESVLIPVEGDGEDSKLKRLTACISSQVGCAMGCSFCLTGIQGIDRNLTTAEIVAQACELRRLAPVTNIVFMGMGEPLNNVENVIRACRILTDDEGLGFSKRRVTVSTSGVVPAIRELGRSVDVSLAISLNASNDEQRSEIMPVNRKWPLADLLAACREYPLGSHRRITFEYVLLGGFNDSVADARRVVRLLRGIPAKVNLIPFNEHPGSSFRRPDDAVVRAFQSELLGSGYTATVRVSRGPDILAACGQLRSQLGTARGSERHQDWEAAQ